METAPLKSFATWARRELITQVSARLTAVLAPSSPERVENQRAVATLERDIAAAGGGAKGKDAIADKVAYTWFNRIIALRFMDANGYTGIGVVSPAHGQQVGQPEILADAKRGSIDPAAVTSKRTLDTITSLLDGTRPSADAQGEAYTLLLAEYCRYWNRSMPFMFEREGDYTELLIPANLLAADSILTRAVATLTEEVCREVEVIGWLYQFYISERKDEVFAGFKKGKKAGAAEIPAATQLFTPHWIVRYLVENSVGRLWMLNHPESRLVDQMDYYIAPVDEGTDFLKISKPEELKVIDPACGSGHMLTYAFDLLYAIYEEEGYGPAEIPGLILTNNLYGAEIDPRAGALAAFALTMKARARQRTFFSRLVEPNVCVIEPMFFSPDELDFLVTRGGDREEEGAFWNQFAQADTVGSLIKPEPGLTARLRRHLESLDDGGDMLRADTAQRATRVLREAEFLTTRYAVVVANPPYMGAKNMASPLASFLKEAFKGLHGDLFSAFIERGAGFLLNGGMLGFMTPNVWMYISSHAATRRRLGSVVALRTLVELPLGGFKGATVQVCAFTAIRHGASGRGHFVRLVDLGGDEAKLRQALLEDVRTSESADRVHVIEVADLAHIPNGALAYWLPAEALSAYKSGKNLAQVAYGQPGLQTSDNSRFIRLWFEVSRSAIGVGHPDSESARRSGRRWFPYLKGGDYRKWYGNELNIVDWEDDGRRIKSYVAETYPYLKGNVDYVVKDRGYYFRPMISYTKIGTGRFAARRADAGHLFDVAGSAVFPADCDSALVLGFLNSRVGEMFLRAQNPTLNVQSGDIDKLPFDASLLDGEADAVRESVDELVRASRRDWDSLETSRGYALDELVAVSRNEGDVRIAVVAERALSEQRELLTRCSELEKAVDTAFAAAYGIGSGDDTGLAPAPPSVRLGTNGELAANLISYAVGCMLGRYSLDEPGLILADQGATLQDYLAKVPQPTFAPDADNVLPIVDGDWFEDDIVARFRQFLRAAFGEEHFEENLRFVEESLGVKTLREYFVTRAGRSKFYDDHVKRYKKRPIYWLFSSPKGSFNALIYMHRYTPSTVSTVLNEYLREFESKLEANLQHQERLAAGDGTPREKAAALKEAERLRKVLLELGEYEHDVLYPLASQQIAIDLDDGVKVNYPRFYPALKKITGLEAADE